VFESGISRELEAIAEITSTSFEYKLAKLFSSLPKRGHQGYE